MTVWIGLLRGVNVGGTNKLPMAEFRASVESAGCREVSTYIQSGNVVFDAGGDEQSVVECLRKVLADRHGLDVPVVVREASEIESVAARHPFTDEIADPRLLHVAFLDRVPDQADLPLIDTDAWAPDRWAVDGRELFLAYPNGSGRSKMTLERFERPWGVTATARNLNTVAQLAGLARGRRN